jgi:hypothetical protein
MKDKEKAISPFDVPKDKSQEIEILHDLYVKLTGQDVRLDMARQRQWFDWIRQGFNQEDLRLVVRHIKRGIGEHQRNQGALKFANLIGMPDRFEEDLAQARAVYGKRRSVDTKPAMPMKRIPAPGEKPLADKTPEEIANEQELLAQLHKSI